MLKLHDTISIPSYWLSAIFNNDFSGYEKKEIEDIKEFLNNYGMATFDVKSYDSSFSYCPLIGLYADCVDLDVYFWESQNETQN